jgi:hypothetical protein
MLCVCAITVFMCTPCHLALTSTPLCARGYTRAYTHTHTHTHVHARTRSSMRTTEIHCTTSCRCSTHCVRLAESLPSSTLFCWSATKALLLLLLLLVVLALLARHASSTRTLFALASTSASSSTECVPLPVVFRFILHQQYRVRAPARCLSLHYAPTSLLVCISFHSCAFALKATLFEVEERAAP